MYRNITRRDFLNGAALTAGAAMMPWHLLAAADTDPEKSPTYYPPALTGLRGSHAGSFEAAHSLRDGTFWDTAGTPQDTGEAYDLIIVGGGISGLAAAHFYRKAAGANARILILENHDDFGGHAKRNEFRVGKAFSSWLRRHLLHREPGALQRGREGLIEELGIDVAILSQVSSTRIFIGRLGCAPKIFFDKETFGTDRLVVILSPSPGGETKISQLARPETWKHFWPRLRWRSRPRAICTVCITKKKDYFPD